MSLSADDRIQIQELIARYNFAIDFGDAEAWADCFTSDGVFDSHNGVFSGRDELRNFAVQLGGSGARIRHWVNNLVIRGNRNAATTKCYLVVYSLSHSGPKVFATGVYDDRLVRSMGEWKFARRKVTLD